MLLVHLKQSICVSEFEILFVQYFSMWKKNSIDFVMAAGSVFLFGWIFRIVTGIQLAIVRGTDIICLSNDIKVEF